MLHRFRGFGVLVFACFSPLLWAADFWNVPSFEAVRQSWQASNTVVLARNGAVLHQLRTDFGARRGQWLALQEMSPALRLAILVSEDRRFGEHAGVDTWAVGAALLSRLRDQGSARGASTVTMQLAALLDADLQARGQSRRSWGQKLGQAALALRLEQSWTKAQILEAYLNLVPFRGELVGADALSRTLFGRAAHALDATQSAIAAALVRGPNARAHIVAKRACVLAQQIQALDAHSLKKINFLNPPKSPSKPLQFTLTPPPRLPEGGVRWSKTKSQRPDGLAAQFAQAASAAAQPNTALLRTAAADCTAFVWQTEQALSARLWSMQEAGSAHAARLALRQARQMLGRWNDWADEKDADQSTPLPLQDWPIANITTTLDAWAQAQAVAHLRRHLRELSEHHVRDGAVVALDNATGQIRAWVGSSGAQLSAAAQFDAVLAPRQVGSTLKPFLYAQALAEKRLTAASLIEDSAAHIDTGGGLYVPQNYDRSFRGWVSVRAALAGSLNVPAVRVLHMVGSDAFAAQIDALGLALQHSAQHYGLSLALGSAELPLLNLTNAYRALARTGWYSTNAPLVAALRLHCPSDAQAAQALFARLDTLAVVISSANLAANAQTPSTQKAILGRGWPVRVMACDRAWQLHDFSGQSSDAGWQALDARAAFIVRDILADRAARAPTFGLRSVLNTPFWSAVKTGTSKDMRDNWAVGFDAHHTVGVWVGNADGQPMHGVSGSSGAAPVWADLLTDLHTLAFAHSPNSLNANGYASPVPPPDLQHQRVEFGWDDDAQTCARTARTAPPPEAARLEWFIAGTAPTRVLRAPCQTSSSAATSAQNAVLSARALGDQSTFSIAWPRAGTILALDPDIGPAQQRLRLRAQGHSQHTSQTAAAQLRWRLRVLGRKNATAQEQTLHLGTGAQVLWLPLPGRHRIELLDAQGQLLDSVDIQVRGAVMKTPNTPPP